ncbi:MAG: carboxymuconolactone decarboxylase family protein [Rhodospirillales bacterium]|jgi:alkylhydroperoxidase family enzyme|nr:carboxymuconolactone decarboxylase family protein [Rhodospirillales bacterium]
MTRVPSIDPADVAPENRDLLARPIALHRALVNSPGALRAFGGLGHYIRHGSTLDPRLREMAILQVGYLARAPYEWSHHIKIGHAFGVTDDDIGGLIAETEGRASSLDPLARTVLRAAREITTGGAVTDATWAALAGALSVEHQIDLVVTIGFYCGVVRVLASLQIEVEDDYMPYLERFPLPA